jgi:hypothetical protein
MKLNFFVLAEVQAALKTPLLYSQAKYSVACVKGPKISA